MDLHPSFDIPLETLAVGEHEFSYRLDDAFFAAFDTDLLRRGHFDVVIAAEKIRGQVNLDLRYRGAAGVDCDRCLEAFELPLSGEDSFVVKFDTEQDIDDGEVIYVPYGTERFNVAKLIFDSIGLSLPMAKYHEDAGLPCDPTVSRYIVDENEAAAPIPEVTDAETEIPADSPWHALEALKGQINSN